MQGFLLPGENMASSSLGRLTLDLAVKLGSFEEGMSKAERTTKQTTNNMGKAVTGFKSQLSEAFNGTQIGSYIDGLNTKLSSIKGGAGVATAALAGMAVGGLALSVAGMAKMAIDTAQADSQLAVLANRANTSVKNFQILQQASVGLGVSQEQLGSILADTQEKLGEFSASQGGGAKDFFEALKNNTKMSEAQIKSFAKTLQGKDGIEAIQVLNDKLDKLGVTSQERRFVFESLASDLGNLAPLFAENGRLLSEYGQALEDVGVIKTEEAIKQSQLLAAQTQAISLQYQGFKNQLVSGFMPAMVDVANAIFGTSKNGIQLQEVGEGIGSVLKNVTKVALGVSAAFAIAGKLIGGVAAAIAAIKGEKINTINYMFDDISSTLEDYGNRIDSLSSSNDKTSKSNSNLVNSILAVNSASMATAKGLAIDTKSADENAKAKEKAAKEVAKLVKEQHNLNKMVGASSLSGLRIKSSEAFAGGQVKGYTANFAQLTQKQLGSDLNRFTAFNDLYHKGTNSKHATGNAFDLTITDATKSSQAVKQLEDVAKRYGYVIKVLDEYKNPSSRATGGHLHVSVLGFNGTADAAKQADAELNVVAQTNAEFQRVQIETLKAQQSVMREYMTQEQKEEVDHAERIAEIRKAFAGDDSAIRKYTELENSVYETSLSKKTRDEKAQLLEVRKNWMSAENYAKEYYALVREEILNTAEYSPEMKEGLIRQANSEQGIAENAKREEVWGDYQGRFGAYDPYQNDMVLLQNALDHKLIAEEDYFLKRSMLQAEYSESYFSSTADVLKNVLGEESAYYQAAFAMAKGMAVAKVALNAPETYSNVYNAVAGIPYVGPYIAPVVAAGAVAVQLAQAATIGSVQLTGMAHNGIDNIPKEGTWLLDGGERVLNPQQNKDLTNYLANKPSESSGSNSQNLQINNILDPAIVGDFMGTSAGTKVMNNYIKNNRSSIKAMIG